MGPADGVRRLILHQDPGTTCEMHIGLEIRYLNTGARLGIGRRPGLVINLSPSRDSREIGWRGVPSNGVRAAIPRSALVDASRASLAVTSRRLTCGISQCTSG